MLQGWCEASSACTVIWDWGIFEMTLAFFRGLWRIWTTIYELWQPPVSEPLYHYAVVRRDLPLGVICAQLLHAAGESSPGNLPPNTHAVVLMVEDEQQLLALESTLLAAGVRMFPIREPDAPWCGALMAIGFPPQLRAGLRDHLRHLPLMK